MVAIRKNSVIKIAVFPGDGIGQDVTEAALPIFEALNVPIELHRGNLGWSCWQHRGEPIPDQAWELIRHCDTTLLGAVTSKPPREAYLALPQLLQKEKREYISPLIQLRQKLDLFANIRPCFNIIDGKKSFNCCIIRENTEGLYSGFDFYPLPEVLHSLVQGHQQWQTISSDEVSCTLRLQSKQGLFRLFKFAFEYAHCNYFTRVTFADKPNVLRQSSAFARDIFESIAQLYPHIQADINNVDAVAYWLIKRPEEMGVVVAENMFGDLLSDVGAAIMGGLGFAPSANIGQTGCYFEPVHGSGLRIKANCANPSAMFLTIGLLLKHFGYGEQAEAIKTSVLAVVKEGRFGTYDVGGDSTTQEMAQAIVDKTLQVVVKKQQNIQFFDDKQARLKKQIEQLKSLCSTEISDALDACGVEGALLHIKPLIAGKKMVGPAYTIQYMSYQEVNTTFKSAANYIDNVPAQCVIVIDNQGRNDCTVWGNILTEVALSRGLAGTVVNGAVRDINMIRDVHYPVYCLNPFMRSGKNRVQKSGEQCTIVINGITIHPGDLIFADEHGVLVIPVDLVDDVINKAVNIQKTEKKIIDAVKAGMPLEQARRVYRYDQPWLSELV